MGSQIGRSSTIPKERFIDYVLPGIIGLILQLLTVTLMACTIARERESGTLYQLMVTSLRRGEIVIGKDSALSRDLDSAHPGHDRGDGLAFSGRVSSAPRAGADLFALSSLLARAGVAHLGLLAHPDAGDPVFGFLSAPGLCAFGRVRAAGATPARHSLPLGMLSADALLPRLSAGESLSGRDQPFTAAISSFSSSARS